MIVKFVFIVHGGSNWRKGLTDEAYVAIREKADMELVKATLSEDKSIISFTYTTPEYLAKTEREKLAVYIKKEPVIYEWKEGKFSAFP